LLREEWRPGRQGKKVPTTLLRHRRSRRSRPSARSGQSEAARSVLVDAPWRSAGDRSTLGLRLDCAHVNVVDGRQTPTSSLSRLNRCGFPGCRSFDGVSLGVAGSLPNRIRPPVWRLHECFTAASLQSPEDEIAIVPPAASPFGAPPLVYADRPSHCRSGAPRWCANVGPVRTNAECREVDANLDEYLLQFLRP
jgi:hypothetical protein